MMRQQALAAEPLEINFFHGDGHGPVAVALPVVGVARLARRAMAVDRRRRASSRPPARLLFAWGYARGPASYLAVTEYSGFLWASALGWLVFRESVSPYTLAGAVLIVGGCLVAARGKRAEPPEIESPPSRCRAR